MLIMKRTGNNQSANGTISDELKPQSRNCVTLESKLCQMMQLIRVWQLFHVCKKNYRLELIMKGTPKTKD